MEHKILAVKKLLVMFVYLSRDLRHATCDLQPVTLSSCHLSRIPKLPQHILPALLADHARDQRAVALLDDHLGRLGRQAVVRAALAAEHRLVGAGAEERN